MERQLLMKEILLIKNGELALKGLNRSTFEDVLIKNIKNALKGLGLIKVRKAQSTIMVEPLNDNYDMDAASNAIAKVFGIAAFSRACVANKDIDDIDEKTPAYLAEQLNKCKTFKVEARRSDKKFELTSPQICARVGATVLKAFPHLTVDVHNPEITVMVEIRDQAAYIHANQLQGAGGLPVGTGGKAAILISGGIDSPVAAYMMSKRGVELTAIHFASPPYTSERAEMKVKELLSIVSSYSGRIKFIIVPFTEIQVQIAQNCPDDLSTLIMRRYMMKIASEIAVENRCEALITGESIGQVASQTMKAIAVTDEAAKLPVFRPLIGMDKEEIVTLARKIGTFETSVLPFEDCCTVFTPKHPRTRPQLSAVLQAEAFSNNEQFIEQAITDQKQQWI